MTSMNFTRTIDHALLVKDLSSFSAVWDYLGVSLGVPFAELTRIRDNVPRKDSLAEFCFKRVIDAWLSGKERNVNKEFLTDAIRGVEGFSVLATEVEKMDFNISKKDTRAGPIIQALKSMKSKYSELGVHLKLDSAVIRQFEAQAFDKSRCLNEMIFYWLHMAEEEDTDGEEDDTYGKKLVLFEALEEVRAKDEVLEQLKKKYKGGYS